jgi:apolipoprotein N-acyltransferase
MPTPPERSYFNSEQAGPISLRCRMLLAILSGLLLTASFPPGDMSWAAWFALVPLLKGIEDVSPFQAFKIGLMAGTVHYLTLMYWIVVAIGHYGNVNTILSAGILFLLCLYLGLYPAFFSIFTRWLQRSRFFIVSAASAWVALEYIRAHLLTGFPWCLLGYSQFKHLHVIQIADVAGVYGVSFLIVVVNVFFYRLLFNSRRTRTGFPKWDFLFAALLAAATIGYGQYRLHGMEKTDSAARRFRIAIIQGNIDQSLKWDSAHQSKTISVYQRLTRSSDSFKPDLIVWPETSVPFFFQNNEEYSPKVIALSKASKAPLLFGSPAYERNGTHTRYYNRAYLVTPDGRTVQHYDKVHLLPFGEYVPLQKILSFVNRLVPAAGDFEPGRRIAPLTHGDLSMGVLICYEAIFPELARTHTREGANVLVNMTNDAWFGMTSAPYQHLCMAAFRAVENRMPMIRAANTGISAYIGAHGGILARSRLFEAAALTRPLEIATPPLTIYARFGDLFALASVILALLGIVLSLSLRRTR